jgi:hypothetical protein
MIHVFFFIDEKLIFILNISYRSITTIIQEIFLSKKQIVRERDISFCCNNEQ